jgi:type IV pilus assembly protein PilQ
MDLLRIVIVTIILLFPLNLRSQLPSKADSLSLQLDSLARDLSVLNERVDFTVNELPLREFIRGVANEVGLNVNLDPSLTQLVTNNFTNVKVKDLLVFLQTNYDIEIKAIGNILEIRKQTVVQPSPTVIIDYSGKDDKMSLEINSVPVDLVARAITSKTGKNVVVTPGLNNTVVKAYIQDMPFDNALDKMAVGNDFEVKKTEDGFFLLEPKRSEIQNPGNVMQHQSRRLSSGTRPSHPSGIVSVNAYSTDSINVKAEDGDLKEIILQIFDAFSLPYQFLGEVNEPVTINVEAISLEGLLKDLFAGTKTACRKMNGIYWFGPRDVLEMQDIKVVQMKYRTIDSLVHIIPDNLKNGVEIKEYPDLNSLILAGPTDRIVHLDRFLKEIDKVIPVVLIEVLIINNSDSKALTTGITAGISEEAVKTSGTILPSVNMTLSSKAVNDLIDGFNGFGWVNLGKVTPNFYARLQALEKDGYIEMRSTPQLSTMNGHKASMSIGKTEYYKEESNIIYGTVTSSSQKTTTYKPVEAELKLEIRPLVAGNQEVTLNIMVEQSDFTDVKIDVNAPPGKKTRKFESIIRVKDQEMVLLGGLEEANDSDTRTGVPLLSRIPILNWIFSSKSKIKSKSKLNIFIKPSIIN